MNAVEALSRFRSLRLSAVTLVAAALVLLRLEGAQQNLPHAGSSHPALAQPDDVNALRNAALEGAAPGLAVLQLKPIHARDRTVGWAVVLGRTLTASTNGPPFPRIEGVTLRFCVQANGRYRNLSGNGPLDDPRFGHDAVAAVRVECIDLDGDGREEVVVVENRPGASWQPSCAFVFRVAPTRLVQTATITSHYPIELTRLNDRNQAVIPATYAIGRTLAHSAQPRWTDYYGFDGQQVLLANRLCREQFRDWPRRLEAFLKEHPRDAELWHFLGRAYQALGDPAKAKPALAKASSLGYSEPDWKVLQAGLQPISFR